MEMEEENQNQVVPNLDAPNLPNGVYSPQPPLQAVLLQQPQVPPPQPSQPEQPQQPQPPPPQQEGNHFTQFSFKKKLKSKTINANTPINLPELPRGGTFTDFSVSEDAEVETINLNMERR